MNDTNFQIVSENTKYKAAIENLYDDVFGKKRKDRTVYFLRTGKKINDLCFIIKKNTDDILQANNEDFSIAEKKGIEHHRP